MLSNLVFTAAHDPSGLHLGSRFQRADDDEARPRRAVNLYLFNNSRRNPLFTRDSSGRPWNRSEAFRADYYVRVFLQPARADYPTCCERCRPVFLSLPVVLAAGWRAIFRRTADVHLQEFIGGGLKNRSGIEARLPSFGFQQPLYNQRPGRRALLLLLNVY